METLTSCKLKWPVARQPFPSDITVGGKLNVGGGGGYCYAAVFRVSKHKKVGYLTNCYKLTTYFKKVMEHI